MRFHGSCSGCGAVFDNIGSIGNHARYSCPATPEQRFWGKIKKAGPDECWLFQGAVNTTGYGMVSWAGKKNIVASRLAWTLVKGQIPEGMSVLHHCDVRRCCNVRHMFLGTYADNGADCARKKRSTWGPRSAQAKLTEEQVREIRGAWKTWGYNKSNTRELASKYGVRYETIQAVVKGKTWKHTS